MTETVYNWYWRRSTENRWRNLMKYGSKTNRGQHAWVGMIVALSTLGETLGNLSNAPAV